MADALASGASVRKDVGVQVPPRAPTLLFGYLGLPNEACKTIENSNRLMT